MHTLEWTQVGRNDLLSIIEYIANENISAAQKFKDNLYSDISHLTTFPMMGREGRITGTRELVISDHYLVVYSISLQAEKITILRVLSTYRQWPDE